MIIDTDVIIWELRGNPKAQRIILESIPFNISVVTYIELVQGMRNKTELQVFLKQLKRWSVGIIQLDGNISSRAMFYVEEFFLSHSMVLADALIAATAVEMNDVLLTANDKHYKHIPRMQVKKFTP